MQDYELLTNESEETTLWDGREWRIHYWKFKADAREFARRAMTESENKEDEDPYAGIYDDVPTSLWKERMTDEDEEDDWEEPLF